MSEDQLPKKYYKTDDGKEPAREFISRLDKSVKAKIFVQIDRAKIGNTGHGHGVGGVSELIIDDGPGYRVYYAVVDGMTLLLLLTAGTKKNQQDDIKTSRAYLENYEKRKKEGGS
jgi:putative addiction module killer protein